MIDYAYQRLHHDPQIRRKAADRVVDLELPTGEKVQCTWWRLDGYDTAGEGNDQPDDSGNSDGSAEMDVDSDAFFMSVDLSY